MHLHRIPVCRRMLQLCCSFLEKKNEQYVGREERRRVEESSEFNYKQSAICVFSDCSSIFVHATSRRRRRFYRAAFQMSTWKWFYAAGAWVRDACLLSLHSLSFHWFNFLKLTFFEIHRLDCDFLSHETLFFPVFCLRALSLISRNWIAFFFLAVVFRLVDFGSFKSLYVNNFIG